MADKLFIQNFPFAATEDDVKDWCESRGFQVKEVKLITERETGKPRGFGFVELLDQEQNAEAIEKLNGKAMDIGGRSRTMTVRKADPPKTR